MERLTFDSEFQVQQWIIYIYIYIYIHIYIYTHIHTQGGSNMTGTDCV
jgi:hypothetical protein